MILKIIFWLHLTLGIAAGFVIALTALTGAIMAFQPQILNWADRHQRIVTPTDAPPLTADELLARVRIHTPNAKPTALTLYADRTRAATATLRNQPSLYLHPQTGEIKTQQNQTLRAFFIFALRLHRWLALPAPPPAAGGASRPDSETPSLGASSPNWKSIGQSIVGISTLVFLLLTLSGLLLWWPRHWNLKTLRVIAVPSPALRGKARDWNWHNALGFLSAPLLLLITFTGLVINYDPLANWIAPREGRGPPQQISPPAPIGNAAIPPPPLPLAALIVRAQAEIPTWENLTLSFEDRRNRNQHREASENPSPRAPSLSPVAIAVRDRNHLTPIPTRLTYHPYSGELLNRSDLSAQPFRRALRTLNLSVHMGTALGWPTQLLALVATLAALVLIYTGFALAFRRFFRRGKRAAHLP